MTTSWTDIGIVDDIAALHAAGDGRVHDDGAYQVAHIGCLTTCGIDADSHLTQLSQEFVGAVDDGGDDLTGNEFLVASDGRTHQDVVNGSYAEQVVGIHHDSILSDTLPYRMKRSDVIDNANIRPGDVIVGLSSTGQATYEKKYNGGMGSNGLTSARHDVFAKYLAENYPESYDHAVPDELVYSGKYKLTDEVEGSPINAGELVLSPTRTYAPVIKKILDELRPEVHGMVHCTGGAQTKVLHFVGENCKVVKDNMFPVPPLFKAIHDCSETDWKEMYQVFNMGHRMEIYVRPEVAEKVIAISKSFNIDAQIVGHIEEGKRSLTIKSEFGTFEY